MLASFVAFALMDVHLIFHIFDMGTVWDACQLCLLGGGVSCFGPYPHASSL